MNKRMTIRRAVACVVCLWACHASRQAQGQAGVLDATAFNQWQLPQGSSPVNGQISYNSQSACTVQSSGYSFIAAKTGRPLTLVDLNPANTETLIPTLVTISGSSCTIQAPMLHVHYSYHLQSATYGLQEALDYVGSQGPGVVSVGPTWARMGGTTAMLTAAHGATGLSILDSRTAALTPYAWSGTAFVASSSSGGLPLSGGTLLGSLNIAAGSALTAPAATFSALTLTGITGCLQAVSGVVSGTACGGLPTAPGAGYALLSSGSGTTYTPTTLAPSATTDTTNAANISSGTLPLGRIPTYPYANLTGTPTLPTAVAQLTRTATDYAGTYTTPTQAAAAAPVQSVNGQTGAVTVTGTLPSAPGSNYALVSSGAGTTYTPTALATSATTDTTNAANIGSGTLAVARLPTIPYSDLSGTPTIPTTAAQVGAVASSAVGAASGVASLDSGMHIPTAQLPLIPVANGGTGTTTPGLIGGTNVTVTGTWPNQTLSATGASLPAATANNQVPVYPTSGSSTTVPTTLTAASVGAVASSAVGAASGVASLDSTTHIPVAQLPTSNIPYASLSGTPTIPSFQTAGSANATQTSLNIAAGSNVTVANSGNTVTISSTGGGAASFTPSAIQFATSSSATRAATTSDINSIIASGHFQSLWQTSKRPRVDLSHSDFGVDGSYATGQNPACTTDNTAAFSAAIAYAVALAATNQSAPVLYIPTGCYSISTGFLLQGSNAGLSIIGDGSGNSIINFTGTSGYALKLIGGNLTSQAYGRINLRGFTLQSTGHLTGATLLELQNAQNIDLDDVALKNTGGIALNLVNTERSVFHNLELDANARAINGVTSSNEDYFFNTHVMSPGQDLSNYVYNGNPNAVSGTVPTSGATIRPNYNAAVTTIAGQNFHMSGGSVKGTVFQGAFKFWGANQYSIEHIYVEAFGNGTQNPDLQVGGPSILSTSTSAMTTSTTTTPVNGAIYQPWYVTDQASISNFGSLWTYDIQPPDYTYPGDTTASVLGGGITKGSRESINVAAFYGAGANGAGSVQIANRGINGTTALAWPAGAMFVLPQTANADMVSRDMHYNGNLGIASGDTLGCSQNTLNASWLHSTTVGAPVGSPATVCAEKLIGPVYDGIAALTPNRGFSPSGTLVQGILAEENDYDFIGADSATQAGDGLDFISLNGTIKLNKYDCGAEQAPVTNEVFPAAGNPIATFHSYNDGVCKIQFGFYPNDVGTDSYAHAIVNNLVTGATVDAGIKAYSETTTQYQPYGSKIGPNFWGDYVIQDRGGSFKEDNIGIPFTNPEFKLTFNGSQVFDVLPGAVSVGGNLAVSGNATVTGNISSSANVGAATISTAGAASFGGATSTTGGLYETIAPYIPASTYTFPNGTALAHLAPPSGGQTTTLPAATAIGEHHITLYYGVVNPTTTVATGGHLQLNGVDLGTSWTFPGGWVGAIDWLWDGNNWHNRNTVPFLQPATVTAGAALGTSPTIAIASGATVNSGVVTFTVGTSPVGTSGTVAFTVGYNTGGSVTPKGCGLKPMNANAANALLNWYAPAPNSTAAAFDVAGTALTAGQQYIYRYDCAVNN